MFRGVMMECRVCKGKKRVDVPGGSISCRECCGKGFVDDGREE